MLFSNHLLVVIFIIPFLKQFSGDKHPRDKSDSVFVWLTNSNGTP